MKRSYHTCLAMLFVTVLTVSTTPAAILAHYDFRDGNLLDDESGNGHTLTPTVSEGITLNPDGFSAHIGVNNSNYLKAESLSGSPGSPYTISLWFKTTLTNPGVNASVVSSPFGSSVWQISWANGGMRVNGDAVLPTAGVPLDSNTWYHVALVTDGINSHFYLTRDGDTINLRDSATMVFGITDLQIGVNRIRNTSWEGDYAGVAVYDEALSAGQLSVALENGPGSIYVVPEPASIPLWGVGFWLLLAIRRRWILR